MRGWSDADKLDYAALNADPIVMQHFPATLTSEQSDEMVDRIRAGWSSNGFGLWAVDRVDTGAFIGFVGLSAPTWQTAFTPCIEVGWRLAHHQWGNGFAPEAARAAIDWAFQHVELPRNEIVSFTTVANENSRRVMSKVGLVHDPARDFDHPILPNWHGRRHVLYAIDRRQWLGQRAHTADAASSIAPVR